jgi:hypothetical protein
MIARAADRVSTTDYMRRTGALARRLFQRNGSGIQDLEFLKSVMAAD